MLQNDNSNSYVVFSKIPKETKNGKNSFQTKCFCHPFAVLVVENFQKLNHILFSHSENRSEGASCVRKKIVPTHSCRVMQGKIDQLTDTCEQYREVHLCTKTSNYRPTLNENIRHEFDCSFAQVYCSKLLFGIRNYELGKFAWYEGKLAGIEHRLESLSNQVNFILLKCKVKEDLLDNLRRLNYAFQSPGSENSYN